MRRFADNPVRSVMVRCQKPPSADCRADRWNPDMSPRLTLTQLNAKITDCRKCGRLVDHCASVARTKTARYRDQAYWGKPVPNFLPKTAAEARRARLLIVGLAPGAHGANRTGRMFTGDRSGDFLYAAMHKAGLCNQGESIGPGDGLVLHDTVVTSAGHCAPPGNRPTAEELNACSGYLEQTFEALPNLGAVLSLGGIAHRAVLGYYKKRGVVKTLNRYPFGHGAAFRLDGAPALFCCYHPSQQNTFTGRLTPRMLLDVLVQARECAGVSK